MGAGHSVVNVKNETVKAQDYQGGEGNRVYKACASNFFRLRRPYRGHACRILKYLAERRARKYRMNFSTAEQAGLIARETKPLRRGGVSTTLRETSWYKTQVVRLREQAAARRSHFHSRTLLATTLRPSQGATANVHWGAGTVVGGVRIESQGGSYRGGGADTGNVMPRWSKRWRSL